MQHTNPTQHPTLQLGALQIPGPALPISIFLLPLIIPSHILTRIPSTRPFESLLKLTHLIIYNLSLTGIFPDTDNTVPLIAYTTLILGEALLQKTKHWRYTCVGVGWILPIMPGRSFHALLEPQSTRAVILLVLALPGVLREREEEVSFGATVSALCLFARMEFLLLKGKTGGNGVGVRVFAGLCAPALAFACYPMVRRGARRWQWCNRLRRVVERWIPWELLSCLQACVAMLTLAAAGVFLNGFLWSCFRWRWLLCGGKPSRAPAWTVSSFFVGYFLFVPLFCLKWWLLTHWLEVWERPAVGNIDLVVQRHVLNCLAATWWATCVCLVLWLALEILVFQTA